MNIAFGPRWDAPDADDALYVDTPVGERCGICRDPIEADDQGWMRTALTDNRQPTTIAIHAGCEAAGIVGHQLMICTCTGRSTTGRATGDEVWRRLGHAVPRKGDPPVSRDGTSTGAGS